MCTLRRSGQSRSGQAISKPTTSEMRTTPRTWKIKSLHLSSCTEPGMQTSRAALSQTLKAKEWEESFVRTAKTSTSQELTSKISARRQMQQQYIWFQAQAILSSVGRPSKMFRQTEVQLFSHKTLSPSSLSHSILKTWNSSSPLLILMNTHWTHLMTSWMTLCVDKRMESQMRMIEKQLLLRLPKVILSLCWVFSGSSLTASRS